MFSRKEQRSAAQPDESTTPVPASPASPQSIGASSPASMSGRQRSFSRNTLRNTDSPRPSLAIPNPSLPDILADEQDSPVSFSQSYFDAQGSSSSARTLAYSPSPITTSGAWRRPGTANSVSMTRRPSSPSAASQSGSVRRNRRLSSDSSSLSAFGHSSGTSPAVAPRFRTSSSRSKILASSAVALESSSPPLQSSLSGGFFGDRARERSVSPMPPARSPPASAPANQTATSTNANGGPSIMDRKRRLANVSGGAFDDGMPDNSSISGRSLQTHSGQLQSDQSHTYSPISNPAGGADNQRHVHRADRKASKSSLQKSSSSLESNELTKAQSIAAKVTRSVSNTSIPPQPSGVPTSFPAPNADTDEKRSHGTGDSTSTRNGKSDGSATTNGTSNDSSSHSFKSRLFGLRKDKHNTAKSSHERDEAVPLSRPTSSKDDIRPDASAAQHDHPTTSKVSRLREEHQRAIQEQAAVASSTALPLSSSSHTRKEKGNRLGSPAELDDEVRARREADASSVRSYGSSSRRRFSHSSAMTAAQPRVAMSGSDYPSLQERGVPSFSKHKRMNSREGNVSLKSKASLTSLASTSSVPARGSSLMQNRPATSNAVPVPLASPTSSSYQSVPHSPVIAASMSHDELYHQNASGPSSKHTSWRHSTLSTAAGQSGAGALAAIRARFGEPVGSEGGSSAFADTHVLPQSLSQAALKINEGESRRPSAVEADLQPVGQEVDVSTSNAPAVPSPQSKLEPSRPVKSPLRVARQSTEPSNGSSSFADLSGQITPSTSVKLQEVALSDKAPAEQSPLSPLRKSLEEMGLGGAVWASQQASSGSLAKLASSTSQTSIRLGSGPPSAMASGAIETITDDAERQPTLLPGASVSTLSLTTDDGTQSTHVDPSKDSSTRRSKRNNTLRKVTPPVLFGSKTHKHAAGNDSRIASQHSDSSPSASGSRKKSIWRLGLGKGEHEAAPPVPTLASSTTTTPPATLSSHPKGGRLTIRGRKSDPQVARPPIRRIFDGQVDHQGEEMHADVAHMQHSASQQSFEHEQANQSIANSQSLYSVGAHDSDSVVRTSDTPDGSRVDDGAPVSLLKQSARRSNAIRELVETEKSYASDLAVIRDVYIARAKSLAGIPSASPLQTPLSTHSSTTMPSPAIGTPMSAPPHVLGPGFGKATPPLQTNGPRFLRQQTSYDAPIGGSGNSANMVYAGSSAKSVPSSTNPSNRSSTYTTSSSHTSSDASLPWATNANGGSQPGTPNLGTASSVHRGLGLGSASPAPSVQQAHQPKGGPPANLAKIHTSAGTPSALSTPTGAGEAPLSMSDMRVIFAQLENCLGLALDTAITLQDAAGTLMDPGQASQPTESEKDHVGQAFLTILPRIEVVFTAYCSRHEASMQRLQDLNAHSPKAVLFLRECTEVARKLTTAWDLGSLLIKPVQRVLKYPLLLRQILNATQASHPDHANLEEALRKMQVVADKINQVKRRRDLADYLISGRDRDPKSAVSSSTLNSSQLIRGKKKPRSSANNSSIAATEDVLLTDEALEAAAEEYGEILKRFEALQRRVAAFGRQCGAWSHSLRECYYAQLRILTSLRRIYALRAQQDDEHGQSAPVSFAPSGPEDALIAAYMDVIKTIINRSWRQMDSEIRSAILPMTLKIESMFGAPRIVMLKKDERESDYVRCRQQLLQQQNQEGGPSLKGMDRKVIEGANGFVALQAQLIDELPAFVQGVQLLLDVGVQAFARLQAAHFDDVRSIVLEFWSETAGHSDEVDMIGLDDDELLSVGPTLRQINPVRAFWESHSAYSQWSESLAITRRDSELSTTATVGEGADPVLAPDQANINGNELARMHQQPPSTTSAPIAGAPSTKVQQEEDLGIFISPFAAAAASSRPSSNADPLPSRSRAVLGQASVSSHGDGASSANSHSHSPDIISGPSFVPPTSSAPGTRRPSLGVVGLMRTLSGTFTRENSASPSAETVPPMPDHAVSNVRMHSGDSLSPTSNGGRTVSILPPSLPSLVFRDDGSDGFFIQNKPIEFLESASKEPYRSSSPNTQAADQRSVLDTVDTAGGMSSQSLTDEEDSTRENSFVSASGSGGDLVQQSYLRSPTATNFERSNSGDRLAVVGDRSPVSVSPTSGKGLSVPRVPAKLPQSQKLKILFQCVAVQDAGEQKIDHLSRLPMHHMGWPFIQYRSGDTFRALSSHIDPSSGEALLFGRLDRSGELGWVEKANFAGGSSVHYGRSVSSAGGSTVAASDGTSH